MAADLTDIYGEFRLAVSAVQPTLPLTEADYITLFKRGIRKMYIDTGRSEQYSGQKLNVETMEWDEDMGQDEQWYACLAAQVAFCDQIILDASGSGRITQHKTDALTVVYSDKGAGMAQAMRDALRQDLTEAFHKMPQYAEPMGG